MSATLQNIQEAIALEQLREVQEGRGPNKAQVERDIQLYSMNPNAYSSEQIVDIAQRAAAVGLPFEPKTSLGRLGKNVAYGLGSGATFGLLGLVPGLKPDALTSTEKGARAVASALGIAVGGPAAVGGRVAAKGVGALARAASGSGRVAQLGKKAEGLTATGKAALESGLKYGFAGTTGTVFDEGLDPGRGVMMGGGAAAISAMRAARLGQQVGKPTSAESGSWGATINPQKFPKQSPPTGGEAGSPITPIMGGPQSAFTAAPTTQATTTTAEVLNATKTIKVSSKLSKVKADRARQLMRDANSRTLTSAEKVEVLEAQLASMDKRTITGKATRDLILDRIRQIKGS